MAGLLGLGKSGFTSNRLYTSEDFVRFSFARGRVASRGESRVILGHCQAAAAPAAAGGGGRKPETNQQMTDNILPACPVYYSAAQHCVRMRARTTELIS
jgi:hypothetical protein